MGRHRSKNKHLPPNVEMKGGRYYFRPYRAGERPSIALGDDYTRMLLRWRELHGLTDEVTTVCQAIDSALAIMTETLKSGTIREYTRAANMMKLAFKGFAFEDVKPVHLSQYLAKRKAKISANREVTFFSSMWDIARQRGWTDRSNPATGAKFNKEKKRKRIAAKDEQQKLLYDEAGNPRDCQYADMVAFAIKTGLRESDMLAFTLAQISDEGLLAKPRKTDASTEAELLIEWDDELRQLIDRCKARRRRVGSIYLFPTKFGTPYTLNGFQSCWHRYFEACGVSGLRWHDFRRTGINSKKKETGSTDAAKDFAAHSSVTTTEGYLANVGVTKVTPIRLKQS